MAKVDMARLMSRVGTEALKWNCILYYYKGGSVKAYRL